MTQHHNHLKHTTSREVGHEMAEVLPESKSWIFVPHLRGLNIRILVVLLSAATLGFDATMMNGLQALSTWREFFDHPKPALLGTINAMFPLGKILGAMPSGWFADKYGRKYTLAVGIAILIVGAALQGASQNLAMFIVSRFILGVGSELGSVPAPVLVTELAYPPQRGKVTSLYQTVFYVGAIGASWSTFGSFQMKTSTWSWRIPSLLQGLCPLIQLCFIWFVPESPRWLVGKGRTEDARAIVTKWHGGGDDSSPIVEFEMREMVTHLEAEAEVADMGWKSLFKTRGDIKRTLVACYVPFLSQWTGTGLVTYYLSLVLNTVGITKSFDQTLINGVLQIFNFFAAVGGALMVDRAGRRPLLLFSCIGMLWSFTILTACAGSFAHTRVPATGIAVVVFIFVYYFHYDVAITPLTFSYPAEIVPFHTRQKTMAASYLVNALLLMFNSFVNPIALSAIGWRYYIVYICLIGVSVVVVFLFFPETRGHTLESIADVFEGPALVYKNKKVGPKDDEEVGDDAQKVHAVELVEEASRETKN